MLSVGSLFSGIGGFDLGLERAGMRTVWFCEQDEFCRAVLAEHWPGVPCYPDITELRGADVEPVDVLCGGFPCQDLSYAGAGAGLAGARSGLWSEYARLIRELRPRYVVVENVSALLARGLGTVLGDLAACGYDAEWDCIPASAVGAPHRRDRIWLVAYPGGEQHEGPRVAQRGETSAGPPQADPDADARRLTVCGEPDGRQEQPELPASQRRDADRLCSTVADADESRVEGHGRPVEGAGEWATRAASAGPGGVDGYAHVWLAEPDVGRVAHGVPARVDRLAALGNALVPQIAEWIGRRIIAYELEREGLAA